MADLRAHHYRIHDKFRQEDFFVPHSFPLEDLVFFAQDLKEDFWFAWRVTELEQPDPPIYLLDEVSRAPPPRCIAQSFEEFVFDVCLGDKIDRMGLKKFYDGVVLHEDSESDWSSDNDEETVFELPPQVFKPFPGGRGN
eukprot:TRINITY_DN638_c0_g1_i4.p1 TRINITY_DN638_c0_g1~~TRINITY_DN638_c0_g1_i4.p1  ORF type:complete len:139 (-),score=34.82 TRINITY_DN638_c0_g1_i4:64-480(-)